MGPFPCRDAGTAVGDALAGGTELKMGIGTPFVDALFFADIVNHADRFGWPSKAQMASVVRPSLPDGILNRPKTGFGLPFFDPRRQERIANEPPQRTWAREALLTYLHEQKSPVACSRTAEAATNFAP